MRSSAGDRRVRARAEMTSIRPSTTVTESTTVLASGGCEGGAGRLSDPWWAPRRGDERTRDVRHDLAGGGDALGDLVMTL